MMNFNFTFHHSTSIYKLEFKMYEALSFVENPKEHLIANLYALQVKQKSTNDFHHHKCVYCHVRKLKRSSVLSE